MCGTNCIPLHHFATTLLQHENISTELNDDSTNYYTILDEVGGNTLFMNMNNRKRKAFHWKETNAMLSKCKITCCIVRFI